MRFMQRSYGAAAAALVLVFSLVSAAAVSAGPAAYIGLFKENAIGVLDTATGRLAAKIPIPAGPHGLVETPDGTTLYASSDGDTKVSVIDTATNTVRKTIEVGSAPHGLAITPDGRRVLAAVFGANAVAFIDTASNTVVGRVPVSSPHNIAISPDGRTAYAAAQMKGSLGLVIIDVSGAARKGVVPLDKMPRALGFSPDGRKLYFTLAGSDSVQVLDTASNAIVKQIPVGASPHHPLFTPDGRTALVVSQGPGELYIIDAATDTVRGHLKVGTLPHWIAVSADGKTAYVTNEGSGDVTVVDLGTSSAVATIPVGEAPRKIVVQPAAATMSMRSTPARISGFSFPDSITVPVGRQVVWTNADAVPHTVTADDRSWTSGPLDPGKSFAMTFSRAGTFSYHCDFHPAMTGVVVVTPAS